MRSARIVIWIAVIALLLGACGGEETQASSTAADRSPTTTAAPPPSTSSTATGSTTTSNGTAGPSDTLLVVGDWGSGTVPEGAVAGAMARYAEQNDISAILTTGDNFYLDDWEFLMEPYGWATEAGIPFWITWGNHDVESEVRIEAVNEAFDDPPRWNVHDWGAVDVIVLDSNQITSPRQAMFFLDAMDESDRPTIVAMHHPPYSCAHHGSTTDLVNQVVPILDDDVVLVLSGHEHVYQRFEHQDVAYVVTGGGGAPTYELSECPLDHPEPLAGERIHHFLAMEQTPTGLQVTAIDVNGNVFDEVTIDLP